MREKDKRLWKQRGKNVISPVCFWLSRRNSKPYVIYMRVSVCVCVCARVCERDREGQ